LKLSFLKMQAQGNDFVILDGISTVLPELSQAFVQKICDRHLGIGCDQLLVLQRHDSADALMHIFNIDGSRAENCGNGLRCAGDLLMNKLAQVQVSIALADRMVQIKRTTHGVAVAMGEGVVEEITPDYTDIRIGNPHRVYFQNPLTCPERNVEIVSEYDAFQASIRIFERGVGETLACGSGACATAIAVWQKTNTKHPLDILMPGGKVQVLYDSSVVLQGEVAIVFSGIYNC